MKPLRWKGNEYSIVLDKTIYPNRYRFKKVSDLEPSDKIAQLDPGQKIEINQTAGDPTMWELTIK